ncbi:MAG: tRNA (guanosine(37)-N1)-methyltransferase TrmD [Clostridium sp.]|nr:tRNA (guanosine(37)-N1)-methyltransferase TrmD [Clostridium sp.]
MNFHVLTLFPELIEQGVSSSITGRAMAKGTIKLHTVNIRDYSTDEKHHHVDDYPYGGGAGMVMQAEPVYAACEDVCARVEAETGSRPRVIYMSPQGRTFTQKIAEELAKENDLVFLCGHYEGIDERALELSVTDQISIGDYVLTGGELPAMVIIDCVSRLVPGVLSNDMSAEVETFHDNLLEYPQYTRPEEFMGLKVPPVLLSGDHGKVDIWRRERSIERTLERRPDLLENAVLSEKERKFLRTLLEKEKNDI